MHKLQFLEGSLLLGFLGAEPLKPVNVKIAQLAEALESVSAEIRYMQTRDKRHRSSKSVSHLAIIFSLIT
jgi:hypothetical protein